MQFRKPFKIAIRAGQVTRSFRVWQKPQATVGGRYNLRPEGAIEVTAIRKVKLGSIRAAALKATGIESVADLKVLLSVTDPDAELYQVDFRYLGSEPVKQPDTSKPDAAELETLRTKLHAMDSRSGKPWTMQVLLALQQHPGSRAADLASVFDWPTNRFKAQVRKLKTLGLTLSLETGYRLSERGEALLAEYGTDKAAVTRPG